MTEPAAPLIPEVTITPRDNGPYRVAGPIALIDAEGNRWDVPPGRPVFLCRCGQSQNKPFCDGAHNAAGFASTARAPLAVEATAER